jgi:hypothetical protein
MYFSAFFKNFSNEYVLQFCSFILILGEIDNYILKNIDIKYNLDCLYKILIISDLM